MRIATNTCRYQQNSAATGALSAGIQVWLLRHGRTDFDYEHCGYQEFMQMLTNGQTRPLVREHGIDFGSLPKQVGFVGYSPTKRAWQTAEVLCQKLEVKQIKEMPDLREVRFDEDIIQEWEYRSLPESRPLILQRWWEGRNKAESFSDSVARVKEIESFLSKRQEDTVILITHGWFLRLLDLYFVQGRRTDITLEEILDAELVPLGHSLQTTVARDGCVQE